MSVVNTYKVYEGQSWLDISNDIYGHIMFAFDLAILNGFSPSDTIPAGKDILFTDTDNDKNVLVLKSLITNKSIPATALTAAQNEQIPTLKGIGVMKIDNTFKVE